MAKLNMRCAALLLLAQFTLTLGQTTAPTYAPTPPGHTYDRGTYAPSVTTDAPTFTLPPTTSPTYTDAPTFTPAPTVSPSTITPSTLTPTLSPTTGAPTQSPTVPPTMPSLTDAQAVAAIAAARARVAYRNNAVAPASIDPVADGRGGLVCPADYHLMGGDDKAIDHSNSPPTSSSPTTTAPTHAASTATPTTITLSPTTTTLSPTTAVAGLYWCQRNDEIFRSVTYQKTLDPTGTVLARAQTATTMGEARDLSQEHDVEARAQHALIEASGQTLLEETVAAMDTEMLAAKTGDAREATHTPTVTMTNSPTTPLQHAEARLRAQNVPTGAPTPPPTYPVGK